MANFLISLQITLAHEGLYSNDPDDAGKETFRGISRKNHPDWDGWAIVDKNKGVPGFPANLVKNDTINQLVQSFYQVNFWKPISGNKISNQNTADSIFDFAVNTGTLTSIVALQSIVGAKLDGVVGDQTLNKLNSMDFGHFQAAFTLAKIDHYIKVIEKRPSSKKYLYGWIIRALSFHN
jgi:lysozyme family protein